MDLVLGDAVVWLPGVALLGVAVGLIAGMFGVGGGFLLVPLMHVTLGVPLRFAVGAGLCQTIATALGAQLRYRTMGHAESRLDLMLLGGSLLGVDAGTRLLALLGGLGTWTIAGRTMPAVRVVMTASYAAIFLIMAWVMWTKPVPDDDEELAPGPLARLGIPPRADFPVAGLRGVSGPLVGVIGFANGVFAGMLGIGGGILLIPIMLYGFGFNIKKAAGTGIVIVLAVAAIGTVQHARLGNVHLGLAMTLGVGAALSAQVGASLTRSLSARALRRGLAVALIATVASLVVKLVG